jgi:hypothetical protein
LKVFLLWLLLIAGLIAVLLHFVAATPGAAFAGTPGSRSGEEAELARYLRDQVQTLSHTIGERGVHKPEALAQATDWIEGELRHAGYSPIDQPFQASGVTLHNLAAEIPGSRSSEIVILCAHYDSPPRSPGADDNGSGCAALLAIAGRLSRRSFDRTLRFVFFAGGEGLLAGTDGMGSRHAAQASRAAKERIVAVLSLDTLGYYSDADHSQTRPFPLGASYPDHGDFLAFIADVGSRDLMQRCVADFRASVPMPAEGACLPGWIPGLRSGDQASYWNEGFKALLVTDTGILRNGNFQKMGDTYDRLDYTRLARVVMGLEKVAGILASRSLPSN